jgi:glucosamine-6-phosphate deaminase
MRVLVTPDYRTLSKEAAELVARTLRPRPDLTLGLPTGNTPLAMYAELVRKHRDEGLDFSRVKTFNLDEYLGIPADHPQSYHAYMRSRFFNHVNVLPEHTHIPDGSPGVDATVECARYEDAIRDSGGIDLLIVGIGANGHIAFNEPGSSFDSRTRVVSLAEETIANAGKYFASDQEIPRSAITMGIRTILEAGRILLLASGRTKATAVDHALRGPISESVPASALRLHPNVIAILDEQASGTYQ